MIQFLKNWWKALVSSPPDDTKVEVVTSDEALARFIYQKNDWSKQPTPMPKAKVFLPMMHEGKLETSVCRISNISEQRIWEIAHKARSPMPALARADLIAMDIAKIKLNVVPAPNQENDYLEHAVIMGWPENKEDQLALANELVASSNLKIAPK